MTVSMVSLLLDGIVLLIFLACTFRGWQSGFAKSFIELVAKFAALLCAWLLCKPLAQFIFDTFLREGVMTLLEKNVATLLDPAALEATLNSLLAQLPPALSGAMESFGANELGIMVESMGSASSKELFDFLAQKVVEPAIVTMLKLGVFLLIFLVTSLLANLLASALGMLNKVPILGAFNRVLGAALGMLQGALFVSVFALAASFLAAGFPDLIEGFDAQALGNTVLVAPIGEIARELLGLTGSARS